MDRLEFVDIFRGIALLVMVTIQIFDYLSVSSIYTTAPYFVSLINSVTWVPPSLLFTFVSGMGVFLLVKKRIEINNLSKRSTFWYVVKRYGKYILISLPFTIIMWDLSIFFGWNEAIQGIGLSAIFVALFLILFFKYAKNISKTWYVVLIGLIVIFAYLQSVLPLMIDTSLTNFPRVIVDYSLVSVLGTTFLNAFFRGWFSVVNLFPLMLGGLLFINLIRNQASFKKLLLFGLSFLLVSIILHLFGDNINYYGRSFSLTFFAIGQSALICVLAYFVYKKAFARKVLNFLKIFGFTAFFCYVFHYLFILKVLEITHLKDLLPDLYAWMVTIPLVLVVYVFARYYSKVKTRLPKIIQL